jgi:hypothetical protein
MKRRRAEQSRCYRHRRRIRRQTINFLAWSLKEDPTLQQVLDSMRLDQSLIGWSVQHINWEMARGR